MRLIRNEAPHPTGLVEYKQKTYDVKTNHTSPESNETHPSSETQKLGIAYQHSINVHEHTRLI
jgi:hypothetical protein